MPLLQLSAIYLVCTLSWQAEVQVNNYAIVLNFFHISHNLIWLFSNCPWIYQYFPSLFNLWTDKTIHVNLCKKLHNLPISKWITCTLHTDIPSYVIVSSLSERLRKYHRKKHWYIKFMLSKKAAKIDEIFTVFDICTVKSTVRISSNFVAFLENTNFILECPRLWRITLIY